MNHATLIFLGLLVTFVGSWSGMVVGPQIQLGRQGPMPQMQAVGRVVEFDDPGETYPVARLGLAEQGRLVYRREGCYYCHSQQVNGSAADARWTKDGRFSVHRDYLFDQPAFFGSQRLAPDLANAGLRMPDANWHLLHLYAPQAVMEGSSMPPYTHLFEKRKIGRTPSPDALPLSEDQRRYIRGLAADEEIVPKAEARALTAYLISLRQDVNLFEAPMYPPKTNAVSGATNAVNGGATP